MQEETHQEWVNRMLKERIKKMVETCIYCKNIITGDDILEARFAGWSDNMMFLWAHDKCWLEHNHEQKQ